MPSQKFRDLFGQKAPLIGMVHVLALPGTPGNCLGFERIKGFALKDAQTLYTCGFDGMIIENMGDSPFFAEKVGPETIAYLTAIACRIREVIPVRSIGINVGKPLTELLSAPGYIKTAILAKQLMERKPLR